MYNPGVGLLSVKSQIENILDFSGLTSSIAATQLCACNSKAAIGCM